MQKTTDNYRKHTSKNPVQKYLIERFYTTFLAEIKKLKPDSILDVGCGEGFTLERLQDAGIGKKLEGVDYLDTAIQIGRKQFPQFTLRQGNIYALPYKDDSFDLLICSEVLEHLEHPDEALKELFRVTKKYVVFSVPNEPWFMASNFIRGKNWSRLGNDIEHINHWTSFSFARFIQKEFKVRMLRKPFPWTIIIAEK